MSVYGKLGVEPIVNACGTVTRLGGAVMPPEVREAWASAAEEAVSLEQLQGAAARRIADATGTESGLVASGAAAALTLGAASILTGHNLGRMERLPCCDGFPNEFIMAREQRSGYDHAIRASGARLVEVGFNEIVSNAGVRRTEVWEYEAAITPQTAGIVFVQAENSCPKLVEIVSLAHQHNLPVLVDAAGELPPRSRLKDISATGADLVCFSGGKAIRGPQSTGILCGKRSLISAAALQMLDMDDHLELWNPPENLIDRTRFTGIPRHGIGRGLKVSKEEIVALMTALELFTSGAYDAQVSESRSLLQNISRQLSHTQAGFRIIEQSSIEQSPILEITLDASSGHKSAIEVCAALRAGSPPVYVGHAGVHEGILYVNPVCLNQQSTQQLIQRLDEELA